MSNKILNEAFVFSLSYQQQRLWLLDQMLPGNPAYNITAGVRLRGKLDLAVLRRSLNRVIERHESLRTIFRTVEGQACQFVLPALDIDIPLICHGASSLDEQQAILNCARDISDTHFDLAQGPLLQSCILELGPDDHVFFVAIHHIVADGWSMMVLVRDLMEAYKAFHAKHIPDLPDLPIQYADFTEWQHQYFDEGLLNREMEYWKQQLSNVSVLDIPTDYPRPAIRRNTGSGLSSIVPQQVLEQLAALGRRQGATTFMVLLTAFKVLLHRYSGGDDIAVGTPVAGRDRIETERLIGCFLNTVVVRTQFPERASFVEILKAVRKSALDAYSHQQVPFEKVLEATNPERDLSTTPLFQVFFNMLNLPEALDLRLPDLEAELLELPEANSKFDMTLYVRDRNRQTEIALVYDTELFSSERMAEMLRQFKSLLSQTAADPNREISEYSLVTDYAAAVLPDTKAILDDRWEGAVHDFFRKQARYRPLQLAVADANICWNYQELDTLSDRLANCLASHGVLHGDRVAIYAHRGTPLVLALLGIMKAGGVFLILDPAYPPARLIDYIKVV